MLTQRLRHRIDIEEVVEAADDRNAQSETWATIRSSAEPELIPAEVVPVSGREFLSADALQSGVTTKITIRWRDGIDPITMRVVHGDLVHNIKAVLPDKTDRRALLLMCERGVKSAG